MGGAVLNRADILAVKDARVKRFPVAEWNGDIFLRSLTAAEREKWESVFEARREKTTASVMALLAAYAICDENGNSLFTEEDVSALAKKDGAVMLRIAEAAMAMNAVTEKDIADIAKN
jgi:hypothetical protein